ncbi:50S ribosomal protein L32 [Acetobacteraceae bacterium]|nr:50S ribosomal protein L32 [Candidatus Parcubacteria bacterium]
MVVRMRHTRAHTGNRRSHHAIKAQVLSVCECGAKRVSHRACPVCGRYKGRVVIDLLGKSQARTAKRTQLKNKRAVQEGTKSEAQK